MRTRSFGLMQVALFVSATLAAQPAIQELLDINGETVSAVSPYSMVEIAGEHFSGDISVFIQGKPAAVLASSESSITTRLPEGLESGPADIVVEVGGQSSAAFRVRVAAVTPVILRNAENPKLGEFDKFNEGGLIPVARGKPTVGEFVFLWADGLGKPTDSAQIAPGKATVFLQPELENGEGWPEIPSSSAIATFDNTLGLYQVAFQMIDLDCSLNAPFYRVSFEMTADGAETAHSQAVRFPTTCR